MPSGSPPKWEVSFLLIQADAASLRGLIHVLGGMESDEAHVVQLERELLEPATRANLARVRELLADDFLEVGASGQSFGKAEVLSWLPAESGKSFAVTSIKAVTLGKGVILVTYAAERTYQGYITRSLRSSVWVKGAGGWQMRYHQGTAA